MEIIFVVWALGALIIGVQADKMGRSGIGWGLASVLISPILVGLLLLLVGRAQEGGVVPGQSAPDFPRQGEQLLTPEQIAYAAARAPGKTHTFQKELEEDLKHSQR